MKLRPMGDKLLVRKCFVPDVDDGYGGIILPETAKDTTNIGVVMAIGPKVKYFKEGECLNNKDKAEIVFEDGDDRPPVYVQGPGGKFGISDFIQKNRLRQEGDEYFIEEAGLLPACKFVVG